jgi:hypothetical protein
MSDTHDNHAITPAARCPRCGYDQRGILATWIEQCPLEGTCAECGLAIQWAELLSVKLQRPRWCIEYAASPRDWLRRMMANLALVFAPWAMWRSLKMTDPPRIRRLITGPMLAFILLTGIGLATMRINKAAERYFSFAQGWGITMNVSFLKVGLQNVFLPWSRTSPGTYTETGMQMINGTPTTVTITTAFPAPASMPTLFLISNNKTMGNLWWRSGHGSEPRLVIGPLVFTLSMIVLFPLGFLVLPATRKKAKVRWVHVSRVMLYSLGWLAVPALLAIIAMIVEPTSAMWNNALLFWISVAAYLGTPVFLALFWQAAVKRYLRMPHGTGIAIGVTMMILLLTTALIFYAANPMSPADFLEMSGKALWGSQYHRDR